MTRQLQRARLAQWRDPAAVYAELAAEAVAAVWLDAGPYATDGLSYIGIPSTAPLTESVEHGDVTIFERLRAALEHDSAVDTTVAREDGFALGWVGWFGYELASHTAGVPTSEAATPDAAFVYLDWALEFDHEFRTCDLILLGSHDECARKLGNLETQLADALPPTPLPASAVTPERVRWRHSATRYQELVLACLAAITAGDAYQLCLTNEVHVSGEFTALEVYLRLRQENPSHHGGLLLIGGVALLSSSPEVFLRVDASGHLTTKPIKGTRARSHDQALDDALAAELISSDKERAENLMIVDLMRNDVGRVAELGSVHVDTLLEVESYENVHQLVSTVSAQLAAGFSAVDAIEVCFPAGSMTGAPKISAMNILHKLEQGPRGMYAGAFGYLGIDGTANLAMVIRSIVLTSQGASIGTGGGITSGSIPQAELEETWVKVAPLLRALGVESTEYS
ncbi:para-aminobenzoate synthetase component 1 [Aurantimicrobium minutum]|uniref:anthranilate synthase component I family protein n=1 Tax=Aurantimicrobium minutum TaxID=708131 RepID=UPI002476F0C0|nr:anthranilate synthase component I family protein [Aurantimicrobium minutum]MDH6533141.1 para-aminobenzoate synthetase component 1 [Aurantimicrobium minutum]